MKKIQYDPVAKKMTEVEVKGSQAKAGTDPATTYVIKGEQLSTLIRFAKEDGLDMSEKRGRGRAVNSYVEAAIEELVLSRAKIQAKAQTPASPSQKS